MSASCLLLLASQASANVVFAGDVTPANPLEWKSKTGGYQADIDGYIGSTAGLTGSAIVDGGSALWSNYTYLGYDTGSTGTATITGSGSRWNLSNDLYIGMSGAGVLNVLAGARVGYTFNPTDMYLAYLPGSVGTATVAGVGSRWANIFGLSVGRYGKATLNIQDGASVSASLTWLGTYSGSTGTVNVTGVGSSLSSSTGLFVGHMQGAGMLNIRGGGAVYAGNSKSYLGYDSASRGTVTVAGAGSKWSVGDLLYVGSYGPGTLNIQDGGQVSTVKGGYLGYAAGCSGVATVTGNGSKWRNSGSLYVGYTGTGTLAVENGGQVTATTLSVNGTSVVNMHVSGNGMLMLGDTYAGSVSNAGRINFYADAFLNAASYAPISDAQGRAITCSGAGVYNAVGGVWDSANKQFVVPAAVQVAAGATVTPAMGTRTIFAGAGGRRVGVSTGTIAAAPTLSASPMTDSQLSGLVLDPRESVCSAWDFTTDLTGETLLSFDMGQGLSDLRAWRYADNVWTRYDTHIVYREGIASFTVTTFDGYAVSAVPEPGAWAMLLGGVLTLWLYGRRKQDDRG